MSLPSSNRFLVFYLIITTCYLPISYATEWSCIERPERLMDDLMVVDYWNRRLAERMPVHYNNLLQGGYINMPSARMGDEGELAFGYSWVPPYHNWNGRCQLLNNLEITANYRVFRGIKDPVLSQYGFGDFSDKGANLKFALFKPEDSDYRIPGLAIGVDDFIGTCAFNAFYVVATKVFLNYNFEASLGWGERRIKGFFGGISWTPFRKSPYKFLHGLTFMAEYDAIHYKSKKREPHPKGRTQKSPINFGLQYRLWDTFDFSASYIRGEAFAFSASGFYNLGNTQGFIPKINNPLLYQAPVNTEPLGCLRPEEMMMQELILAFKVQGIFILKSSMTYDAQGQKVLYLNIYNDIYRLESCLRERLNHLLAYLIPEDIDKVTVILLSEGFPIQEYRYTMDHLRRFGAHCMGPHELKMLTPRVEVNEPKEYCSKLLFKQERNLYCVTLLPDLRSYFGSSKGKFKYALGATLGIDGYVYYDLYYSFKASYLFFSDIGDVQGVDRLNPSQIINVRTDLPLYLKQRSVTFPELYLRKIWNAGRGSYFKFAAGYFEIEYGGIAAEFLYYPVNSSLALGFEGALLKKRTHTGLGLTDKISKYKGFKKTYEHFVGTQYFINLYYDWSAINTEFRIKAGQFLAKDYGVRYEVSRYFDNGLRLTMWYTMTNGHDKINGQTYYDKGAMISVPLDFFYTVCSRKRWNYGMSAWLRDVGVTAYTGGELYYLINDQRQN